MIRSNEKQPTVSVIIPCRNEKDYIEIFIDSLMQQDYPLDCLEIVIVDGMSNDGTYEILKKVELGKENILVQENNKKFVSPGLNLAIEKSSGDIIVRMDVHTIYQSDYISQCVKALLVTGADNVGGPARTRSSTYLQKAVSIAYHSPFSVGGARFHDIDYEGFVDTVTYGCWYKKTLEELGLFDEELVRNQDDELNLRMILAGKKIWQTPKICSWYYPRATFGLLYKQYMQYGYWKVRVIQKHRLPASVRHLIPGIFVGSIVVLAALAVISEWAQDTLILILFVYGITSLFASLVASYKSNTLQFMPVFPLVFSMYHLGYGFGFLRGILDFCLLRKASTGFSEITRKETK